MPLIYIDDTGIHAARQDEILAYLQSVFKGIYGVDIDLATETPDGQFIGVLSEVWSDIFQVTVEVFNGRSPAGAIGAALARLVKINGITKKDPAYSSTTVTLGGINGSPVPAGALIGNSQPGVTATFKTLVDGVVGGAAVPVQATVAGPIPGSAGDLSVPLTVVPGWTTVTNASGVALGTTGETDAVLRARRTASVALASIGILDGLEAALLQVPGVTQARVRENPEDTTQSLADGGTLVAHAIEAMVIGGDPAAIAETIWRKRSLGVTMVGGHVQSVTDSQGVAHDIKFDTLGSGIIGKPIYVEVHTATALSGDVQIQVAQAISDRGNGLLKINDVTLPGSQIAETVSVSDIYDAITALKFSTLPDLKVGKVFIGLAPSPTLEDDIPMAFNWIATWDPGVSVQTTFVSP
jgi:uncharacterized phage protein gp47/JayE